MMIRAKIIGGIILLLFGLASADMARITVKGSDTLVRLGRTWAQTYMNIREGVLIHVSGGGSGRGIMALMEGTTDICEASRDMTDEEYSEAERRGIIPYRVPVALDGIVVFVNKENPVSSLNFEQLRKVFTGKITNWKDLGGEFEPIVLYGREAISGTYAFFKYYVLNQEEYSERMLSLPGTAAVVDAVARDKNSIGYGSITWVTDVKYIAVSRAESFPAVLPSQETISNGLYPISRELYWFLNGKPDGELKLFVNWALSEEGQKLAEYWNYVPLSREVAEKHIIE